MPWGEWTAGVEYWGTSTTFGQPVVRWVGDWDTGAGLSGGFGPASDATAAAEWNKAVTLPGVLSQAGSPIFRVIGQALYNEENLSQARYLSSGRQSALGITVEQALQSLPELTDLPPGATAYEYEGDVGDYLGGAWLRVSHYELTNSGVDVRMDLRVLAVPVSALYTPRAFDGSGVTVWSTGAVALTENPALADVTAYADPASGELVITSAPDVVSWTPPTVADSYRGSEGSFSAAVQYRCRTPRVRYLYTDTPPPDPEPELFTGPPPRRVYPRDDYTARRAAPASAAQQHSNRVVGGYL